MYRTACYAFSIKKEISRKSEEKIVKNKTAAMTNGSLANLRTSDAENGAYNLNKDGTL